MFIKFLYVLGILIVLGAILLKLTLKLTDPKEWKEGIMSFTKLLALLSIMILCVLAACLASYKRDKKKKPKFFTCGSYIYTEKDSDEVNRN